MYTKATIYKVYSIIVFVFTILSFIGSIITLLIPIHTPSNSITDGIIIITKIGLLLSSLISLFFGYMDFSSMFSFADMINYEKSNSITPYNKRSFVMPAKAYRTFGTTIFYIVFFISCIGIIISVISYSITKGAFLAIPIIPVVCVALSVLLIYVTYFNRYYSFSVLLNITTTKEPTNTMLNDLKECKPNILRAYCVFLYALSIIFSLAVIILMFYCWGILSTAIGVEATILIYAIFIVNAVAIVLSTSVMGCYFDNLAKMTEHYMIKYKLM